MNQRDLDREQAQGNAASQEVRVSEYDKLRELRNECLNEVPIKMNQLADRLTTMSMGRVGFQAICNELHEYGLKIRRMAEEAR